MSRERLNAAKFRCRSDGAPAEMKGLPVCGRKQMKWISCSTRPAFRTPPKERDAIYSARCTRSTVASSGTGCTVNLSLRASASIGTLSPITNPSIVL